MPNFYDRNSFAPPSHHLPASDEVKDYQLFFDQDRIPFVECVGTHSRSEEINAYLESTDINRIVEKCLLTGDYTPLAQAQGGNLGDLTVLPRTRLDAKKAYDSILRLYNQSDRSVSLDEFVNSLGISSSVPVSTSNQEEVVSDGSVSE